LTEPANRFFAFASVVLKGLAGRRDADLFLSICASSKYPINQKKPRNPGARSSWTVAKHAMAFISKKNFVGSINDWQDGRGFGFIRPESGGQDIFVHIKAFEGQTFRPVVGQRVTFELEIGKDGKKRAKRVLPAHFAAPYRPQRREESPKFDVFGLLAICLFAVLYGFASVFWMVPLWIGALYIAASIVSISVLGERGCKCCRVCWAGFASIGYVPGSPIKSFYQFDQKPVSGLE
jgi:cold shock CspA family protein